MDIYQLIGSPLPFLDKIFTSLEADELDVSNYEMDHLCYRVADIERYYQLKEELSEIGILLAETIISGRPISTFKLAVPFRFQERAIWVLEIPAPKTGSDYPEGFEHVEFVIDEPFAEFMAKHPKLNFQTKAIGKPINPDIQLQYDGYGVKFHRHSLAYVIKYLDA